MDGEIELLGERIAEQAAHLDAATHRLLADLREFDARGGWHTQGALSCAHWLAWRVGWDLVTARDRVRVARKLAEFPTIDDALRRGEVSYSKVRAMLRVATPANEVMILEYARLMTASQLEKLSRKYALVQRHGEESRPQDDKQRRYVRRRDTYDGMVKIEAVLHPEEAELVWTMLDYAAKHLVHELRPQPTSTDSTTTCPSDDSAETPEHVAAGTPLTARCAGGDSAASRGMNDLPAATATAAPIVTACSTGDSTDMSMSVMPVTISEPATMCPSDDSAETRGCVIAVTATPPGTTSTGGDFAVSRGMPTVTACSIGDTTDTPLAISKLATETRSLTAGTIRWPRNDSAETCEHPSAKPGAVWTDDNCAESLEITDSAASRAPTDVLATAAGDDSASLSGNTSVVPDRPLLERLLDEGQALGGGKSARFTELTITTSPEPSPARVREPSVLHQRADATQRAFNRADALVSITQAYLRGDRPSRAPVEVMITIQASNLREGTADPVDVGCMGDSCLSVEAARRLSCDAGVIEVVEDEHGVPLSVGRKRRTIAGSLKRALLKRDTACTFPGCTHRIFLEGHHIRHWADGGETSLMNTALLCSLHHRHVHEYGYSIELGVDQRPQFRDPHGRLVAPVPTGPTSPDLGWPQIRAANEPLAIDADTIACGWDGIPVDYARVIDHLVVADGLA